MQSHCAILYVLAASVVAGCGTQSVYLQDIKVEGPLSVPPVFVVNEDEPRVGQFRLAVGASVGPEQTIEGRADRHTLVNDAGVYQVDTVVNGGVVQYIERDGVNTNTFKGTNFRWKVAPVAFSMQGDLVAGRSLSLTFGLHFARSSADTYLSGTFGAAFSFYSENIGVRIDLGGAWTTVQYDVDYVVTRTPFSLFGGSETYVKFFHDQAKSGQFGLYGTCMLNTRHRSWPVHLFVQLAIVRQTVIELERTVPFPAFDDNIRASVLHHNSFFVVTPGIVVPITSSSRLLLGIRLADETALLVGEPGVLLAPFAHLEFAL